MKRIKFLLFLCGVLVILAAAYIVILALIPSDDDTGPDSGDPISATYTAARIDVSTLYLIGYNKEGSSYSFNLNDKGDAWIWEASPSIPLDNLYFAAMASALRDLTSEVRLSADGGADSPLALYGLDAPWLTISVADEPNGAQTFMFGALNSYNNQYYFLSSAEPGLIYMVSPDAASPFSHTPYEMVLNDSLPSIPSDGVTSLLFRREDNDWLYTYYPEGRDDDPDTPDLWYRSANQGPETALDPDIGAPLCDEIAALTFVSPAGYTEEDKARLGLAQPATLIITYTLPVNTTDENTGLTLTSRVEKSFSLSLGNTDGAGGIYAGLRGSPLSYLIRGEGLCLLYEILSD